MAKSDVVRVGGKLVQRPKKGDSAGEKRFKESVEREQKRARRENLKEVAQKIDEQFKETQFQTVQQAKEQLEKIKKQNPKVYKFMNVKPSTFEKQQNKRIDMIKGDIQRLEENKEKLRRREDKYKDRGDLERAAKYEARYKGNIEEIRELKKFLPRLKKGEILDPKKISDFASAKAKQEERKELNEELQELQEKKIAKQIAKGGGDVEKISYKNGVPSSVRVNGKTVSLKGLSKKEKEGIKLGSVKRGEIKNINKKIKQGKALTVKDFEKARELGINPNDLLGAAANAFKIEKELEQLKKKQKRVQESQIDKSFKDAGLKFITKAFTPDQKKKILNRLTAPTRAKVAAIRVNPNLKPIEKEKRLREVLDISPKTVGDDEFKRDLFDELKRIREIKDKRLRDKLNTIKPGKDFNPRLSKDTVNKLEDLRRKAIRKDENALAAIYGLTALPVAAIDVAIDDAIALANIIKNPKQTFEAIKNLKKKDILRAGGNFGQKLRKGNPRAVSELVTAIAPIKIPGSSKLMAKISKDINKISNAVSDFKYTQNLVKGSGEITIVTRGINQANEAFESTIKLAFRPKQKIVFGTNTLKKKGKTIKQNIKLKDEGAFYIDKNTGVKIPKSAKKVEDIVVKSEEVKAKILSKEDVFRANFDGTVAIGERSKKLQKTIKAKGKKSQVEKLQEFRIEQALGEDMVGKNINEIAATKKLKDRIRTVTRKSPNKKTPKEFEDMTQFLESIRYDKEILNGIDKRTRLAYALGLNKNTAQRLIKGVEQDIKNGYIIVRNGKSYATGSFETVKPSRFQLGPSFAFKNPKVLDKAKKLETGRLKTPQTIRIPDLDSLIYLPSKLPKGIKVPGAFFKLARKYGLAEKYDFKGMSKVEKQKQLKRIKEKQKIPSKVKEKVKTPEKAKKPATKTKGKQRIPSKSRLRTKKPKPIRKPRVITPKIKTIIPRVPRIRIPKLNNLPKDPNPQRQGYIIRIKRGNQVIRQTDQLLPRNRAENLAREIVDGKRQGAPLSKEYEIVKAGKTNIKDVKNKILSNKFITRKTTKNILAVEELQKYRRDNKLEKKASPKKKTTNKKKSNSKKKSKK